MDFQEFLQYVPKLIEVELPANEAHYKMAPLERIRELNIAEIENKNPKNAAVMMLFYPKNGRTHLVLIVRNSYEGVHSAQIAFPGGKYEIEDLTFEKTALRETHEEIGIHPESIEIIMPFTQIYIPPSNFMVYPFLGISKEELVFAPDSNEVAKIIELPLSVFLDDEIIISTTMTTSYAKNIDWGATAMMLSELKDVFNKVL
jgi:8-oxo-dGTP pyrophosphatase MutT (NUDIX family)